MIRPSQLERIRVAIREFNTVPLLPKPILSIVTPTWNTKTEWLAELALSILEQPFLDWEWCIVDDASTDTAFHILFDELSQLRNIHIARLRDKTGISGATNRGLALATGEWIGFVDHDDVLSRDALSACADLLEQGYDAVYTDSDKIDEQGFHSEPFHKPDWSPEYFRGVMYVGHLLCVRREMALKLGGFDSRFDGVQDFEFFLRFTEKTSRIGHIPRVLYHWRKISGSVADSIDAKGDIGSLQRSAVNEHLTRRGLAGCAEAGSFPHRISIVPHPRSSFPRVTVIIPTKDNARLLRTCLHGLFSKTVYPDLEVFCVDNDSSDADAIAEMRAAPVSRVLMPGPFNFSKANNMALPFAAGEYLVFMNNDIEILVSGWIEQMLYYAEQPDIGAVGGLLLFPDGTVQHAGVILGARGTADHALRGVRGDDDGYAGSLSCAREVSAVTAACMMIRRSVFEQVGRFEERFFTIYQDLDLCLKIRKLGLRIVYTPRARFIHHESATRGKYYDLVDRNLLLDSWEDTIRAGDPYYNVNLNLATLDYSVSPR